MSDFSDREFVLLTVTQNGLTLQFAHEDFKKDEEIVLTAIKQNLISMAYAHEDLKDNEEFLYEVNKICIIVFYSVTFFSYE